jgi:hypothetical protein
MIVNRVNSGVSKWEAVDRLKFILNQQSIQKLHAILTLSEDLTEFNGYDSHVGTT